MGPLGQLHNIIVHIRGSPTLTQEFQALAGRMVPLDSRTRWKSWVYMLEVALLLEGPIDTYAKNHYTALQADYLNPQDWTRLRTIKNFLQTFERATLETQRGHVMIDKVIFIMDVLVKYFEIALVSKPSLKSNNTNIVR
jgi:hypothetical protein